jgi:hypothetical protein
LSLERSTFLKLAERAPFPLDTAAERTPRRNEKELSMNVHAAKHTPHKHVAHASGTKGSSAAKDSSSASSSSSSGGSGPVAVVQFSDAAIQAASAAAASASK